MPHGQVRLTVVFDVVGDLDPRAIEQFVASSIEHEAVSLDGAEAELLRDGSVAPSHRWTVSLYDEAGAGSHDDGRDG